MFKLGLAPRFRAKREQLLAEKELPVIALPPEVERVLGAIKVFPTLERKDSRAIKSVSVGLLWRRTLASMRGLLVRTALFAFLAASAASLSTLAGTRILASSTGEVEIAAAYSFAILYFLMNWLARFGMFQSDRLRSWAGLGCEAYLAGLVTQKLVRLSPLAAERQSSGNLKVLITSDVKNVGTFLDNAVRNLLPSMVALVVVCPMITYYGGRAGLIGVGVLLLIIPLTAALNLISTYYQDRAQTEQDRLTTLVGEWVSNIRLIRYLSWESKIENDVSGQVRRFMRYGIGQHFMACVIFGFSSSWWMVAAAGVLAANRWLHLPGPRLELKGFFGSLWLLSYLASYLTHVPNSIRLYGIAAPSMRRLAAFFGEEDRADLLGASADSAEGFTRPKKVHFSGVSFKFPESTGEKRSGGEVLKGVDVSFDLDEKVAILGEVGSGKTTLLRLFTGEYPPGAGTIRIEDDRGVSALLWTEGVYDAYRAQLAFVPQEPFVAQDRFRNNITLSDEDEGNRVVDAAYFAELEADLSVLPQGLDQELGESGVNLSGGQRQRLNLARAIYSGRSFLVLDDTLSAVDAKTEASLMSRLRSREGGFLLVTHRIQELGAVDRVIVLREGRVVESGSPTDLSADPDSFFSRVLSAYEEKEAVMGGESV